MKILDRYIGSCFIRRFLLVLAILVFLFSFFEFLSQLDDVGRGGYRVGDALAFVALTLPGRLVDLIPGGVLLGSIIALGLLSDNQELIAMQASGVSVGRICGSVLAASAIPMLAAGLFMEFVVPPLDRHARAERLAALTETDITLTATGFWARNGPFFVHVRKSRPGGGPVDVDIFEWDHEGRLRIFTHAQKNDIRRDKRWVFTDVTQRVFGDQGVLLRRPPRLTLDSFLSAEQMAIQELPPKALSLSELYLYTRMLTGRGENADQYELVLWQKVTVPLATAAMVLVSLVFVFGPGRGTTAGHRIMMGSTIGIGLYLMNQIIADFGLLMGFSPALTTLLPVTAILSTGIWLLSRGP